MFIVGNFPEPSLVLKLMTQNVGSAEVQLLYLHFLVLEVFGYYSPTVSEVWQQARCLVFSL